MALACFMISPPALPNSLKPSCSPYNSSYVLKSAKIVRPCSIRGDISASGQQLGPIASPTVPQTGQAADVKPTPIIVKPEDLHRSYFPPDFLFGAGTSAIQIEGDGTEGGRGPSTGDYIIHADEGGKGVDSYHKFEEDVRLLKEMGIPHYRFSIAWPRISPDGTLDNINTEGVRYYNDLLDELEKNGITPFVTLFHFDLPEALQQRYHGFLDRRIIQDFSNYCDLCFQLFGNRVKYWMTINEAATFILFTDMCLTPEQREDPLNQFVAGHNLLLCHAAVAKNYKENYFQDQQGEVGMAIVCKWYEPRTPRYPDDQQSADLSKDFYMGWFMHPLKYGDYPQGMKKWVRGLPHFSEEEKNNLRNSCDFFGINYYTSCYTTAVRSGQMLIKDGVTDLRYLIVEKNDRFGIPIGPVAPGVYQINVYPEGLKEVLLYVKDNYENQKMYVTENGCSSYPLITMSIPEAESTGGEQLALIRQEFQDMQRLECFQDHLMATLQAIRQGANVQGYIFWSLMDNCEFGSYDVRFGLSYIDYHDDYKRYIKESGRWYKRFLAPEPVADSRKRPSLLSKLAAATTERTGGTSK